MGNQEYFKGGVLKVRYGPWKKKIGTIKSGTSNIRVLKTVGNGRNKWARIKWSGKVGWVSANYLEKVAFVDTSKTYQVTASALNMRKGAGRNNRVVRRLSRGTSGIKILKLRKVRGKYWANISQNRKKGWVSANYLKVATAKKVVKKTGTTTVKVKYYTVVGGDTLYAVQRKTGKSWRHVAKLNKIQSPYTLTPGQRLILPLL